MYAFGKHTRDPGSGTRDVLTFRICRRLHAKRCMVAPAFELLSPLITSETPQRASRTATDEDARLAQACAEGDTRVFEEIYRGHSDRMKSIAYNHLGNVSDAEDAVQETFLKVHRAASTYNGESAFGTWLYRVLINTCYDALRRRQRRIQEAPIDDVLT